MQQSFDLFSVSSNKHKYLEAKTILDLFGIRLGFLKLSLEEIQSDSIKKIATKKTKNAFLKCNKLLIIKMMDYSLVDLMVFHDHTHILFFKQ